MESPDFHNLLRWIEMDSTIDWKTLSKSSDLRSLWRLTCWDAEHALTTILEELHSSRPYDSNRIYQALTYHVPFDFEAREILMQIGVPASNDTHTSC